jgi:leucyl aminopeptidase
MRINIITEQTRLNKECVHIRFETKVVEHIVVENGARTLLLESGHCSKLTPRKLRIFIRSIVHAAKKHKLHSIAITVSYADFPKCQQYGEKWFWQTWSEQLLLASYEYTRYKSKKVPATLKQVYLVTHSGKIAKDASMKGEIVGNAVNCTRDLANTPGGDMNPRQLGEMAQKLFKGTAVQVAVHDYKKVQQMKMGGLIAVGKGAQEKPRFIVMEYWGAGKPTPTTKGSTKNPIVLVGKGITFDTGGLQVKPGMYMYEMHMDMSGGAAVIGTLQALAKLKLKKNVIGLIPAAENAISNEAMRPGDVITMMSGTTVDVLHTDAEGRIVLGDALHYAHQYNPKLIIDVATLTGAALVAVGQHAHVIMTKRRTLEDLFRDLGEESGDYTFPLPLWDEYKQYIKGVHGDIANIPSGDSKYGGSINGGMFLSHFVKKVPWVHIDMAPRMTSIPSDKLAKGATGEPVRLLVKVIEQF